MDGETVHRFGRDDALWDGLERRSINEVAGLGERFEVAEDGGQEFGDGGVDVHGALDSGVGGAGVHGVEDAVDGFVASGS
jgi:hypothetical protein